jgi:hypothetical protein
MLPPLGIYIEEEARQANYTLNCFGEFTRARFGHSEVFEKMTDEWPSALAPGDKLVLIIAFGRRIIVEFPPRTSEILQSDGVIFYTDGSLFEGRAVTLDVRESYALGSLATVFQIELYIILACSDYCRSAKMHNITI